MIAAPWFVVIIVAVISASPGILGAVAALAALKQGQSNAIAAQSQAEHTETLSKKADMIVVQGKEIHQLVNSDFSQMKQDLTIANARNEKLQEVVDRLQHDVQRLLRLLPGAESAA